MTYILIAELYQKIYWKAHWKYWKWVWIKNRANAILDIHFRVKFVIIYSTRYSDSRFEAVILNGEGGQTGVMIVAKISLFTVDASRGYERFAIIACFRCRKLWISQAGVLSGWFRCRIVKGKSNKTNDDDFARVKPRLFYKRLEKG